MEEDGKRGYRPHLFSERRRVGACPFPMGGGVRLMSTVCEQNPRAGMSSDDDILYEVVDGQRVELDPMGAREVLLASALFEFLAPFARQRGLGQVVSEMLFSSTPSWGLKRRPDLAFVSFPRWREPTPEREDAWDVVPDLAIEIISRTNTAETVDDKIVEYFQAGVRLVWVGLSQSAVACTFTSPPGGTAWSNETKNSTAVMCSPGSSCAFRHSSMPSPN